MCVALMKFVWFDVIYDYDGWWTRQLYNKFMYCYMMFVITEIVAYQIYGIMRVGDFVIDLRL